MNKITAQEYAEAIVQLIKVAGHSTSSGRAAAQVLLSAYNGSEWQLDITDLCCFDHENYTAALTVIRGRAELMREPHEFVKDGAEHFGRLWTHWKRYHISNRHRETCGRCNGSGEVLYDEYDEDSKTITCIRCNGEGLL